MSSFIAQCQEWLLSNPEVMEYLMDRRHMNAESIKTSKIGYFPKGAKFAIGSGDPPELEKLKGRVVVPIYSEFGKVVGYAGRIPDPKEKGWWNTKFVKSSHLYGFDQARQSIFKRNKAYLIEGYFDRIIAAQASLTNSVAFMSADLGIRRLGLLARYCDKICLCFDTDENDAGLLGLLRTLRDMYSIGVGMAPSSWEVTRIKLPVKEDPDDFIFKYGLDEFLGLEEPVPESRLQLAGDAFEELKWKVNERRKESKESK